MWYFNWLIGISLACAITIIVTIWLEYQHFDSGKGNHGAPRSKTKRQAAPEEAPR